MTNTPPYQPAEDAMDATLTMAQQESGSPIARRLQVKLYPADDPVESTPVVVAGLRKASKRAYRFVLFLAVLTVAFTLFAIFRKV